MRRILLVSSLSLTLLSSSTSAQAAQPAAGLLTIDALVDIKHPSNPIWSPDGRRVAFVWNRAGSAAIQPGTDSVHGRRVLLVDDLWETGNILRRVAEVLWKMGASEIRALAMTRTK